MKLLGDYIKAAAGVAVLALTAALLRRILRTSSICRCAPWRIRSALALLLSLAALALDFRRVYKPTGSFPA